MCKISRLLLTGLTLISGATLFNAKNRNMISNIISQNKSVNIVLKFFWLFNYWYFYFPLPCNVLDAHCDVIRYLVNSVMLLLHTLLFKNPLLTPHLSFFTLTNRFGHN